MSKSQGDKNQLTSHQLLGRVDHTGRADNWITNHAVLNR